jgi:hypothetical protein
MLVGGNTGTVGTASAAGAAVVGTGGTNVAAGGTAGAAPHAVSTIMRRVSTRRNIGRVIANLASHIDILVSRRTRGTARRTSYENGTDLRNERPVLRLARRTAPHPPHGRVALRRAPAPGGYPGAGRCRDTISVPPAISEHTSAQSACQARTDRLMELCKPHAAAARRAARPIPHC